MHPTLQQVKARFERELQPPEEEREQWWHAFLRHLLRLAYGVGREFSQGELTLRASSLAYMTLISLVPLLAVTFSVLRAFGVHQQMEPVLQHFLEPLGPQGEEFTAQIIQYVENVRVGVLGALGLGTLFYTVLWLIQKTESAFNYLWRIKRERSFLRRFSDYLSVLLVGPVLVFSAVGATAGLIQTELIQDLFEIKFLGMVLTIISWLMPYLLVIGGFTFVYAFLPNTKVKLSSAFVGGLIAGILWETTGLVFAFFAATSTRYDAIYSSFAIVILFMTWLYISWLILLIGAQLTSYHQNPQLLHIKEPLFLSNRLKERLGLFALALVGNAFHEGRSPPTLNDLSNRLNIPPYLLEGIVQSLRAEQLIRETGGEPPGYLPGQDPDTVTIRRVLNVIRGAEGEEFPMGQVMHPSLPVAGVIEKIEAALDQAVDNMTLRDLMKG